MEKLGCRLYAPECHYGTDSERLTRVVLERRPGDGNSRIFCSRICYLTGRMGLLLWVTMPGLEVRKGAPAPESPEAIALTLPAPSGLESDVARLVARPAKAMEVEALAVESTCPWPISFMRRENFRKGECLFKLGDRA